MGWVMIQRVCVGGGGERECARLSHTAAREESREVRAEQSMRD